MKTFLIEVFRTLFALALLAVIVVFSAEVSHFGRAATIPESDWCPVVVRR